MKVQVCIPCLMTGGTEIQTLSLVKALVAAGHQPVTVCYFEHSDAMVQRYREAGSEVVLLSPDGQRPRGVRRQVAFLYRGLRLVVKQYRPDVAHVQYMAPGALPIILLRLLGVKRIVATAHTSGDIYPSLRLLHWLNDHVLTAFQCITLRAEQSFFGSSQLFSPDLKLKKHGTHFTIYNCLPDYIQVRADARPAHSGPITIGVVSRLERIKGMDLVVPAFAKVHAAHPDTRLLVVGDGSLRGEMEQQAVSSALADVVSFVGRQPQDTLQDWYDKIDILLMPSRSEGFGLTAIEGMARGCVPVVADTGGLPEVVQDGVCGLLHKPGDVDDMAEKIIVSLESIDTSREKAQIDIMPSNAINRSKTFSAKKYCSLISTLYDNLK